MHSPVLIVTAAAAFFGFCLNSLIFYLVLSRGRKLFHYLFAGVLLICALWDLGTFLLALRNQYTHELVRIAYIISVPCSFLPALIYHFTYQYTGRTRVWELYLVWGVTAVILILSALGLYGKIDGVYSYAWGNIFKYAGPPLVMLLVLTFWYATSLTACWLLYRHSRNSPSRLKRRHCLYILAGFLIIALAAVKVLVALGIDLPHLLPLGMLLNDVFVALIGIAIIKDKLLDITLIIKKAAIYSALATLVIFVFSFSEHIFATYLAERIGGHSEILHFLSIGVVIAVLMPFKHRLERFIESYFAHKKLEF